MRIEDKLGDTMRRAVTDEPLPRDVWESFQRRAERSRRVRIAATAVALAAVVGVAAVAVPKIASNDDRGIGVAGSPTPNVETPSASPSPDGVYAGWQTYTQANEAWRLKYPADWETMTFEGQTEFHPKGLSSLPKGGNTFAVALTVTNTTWDRGEKCPSTATCETDADKALFGGRHYTVVRMANDAGGATSTYRVDWGAAATESQWTLSDGQTVVARCSPGSCLTLEVLVTSSTKQLLTDYYKTGDLIVHSIERL